MNEPRKYKLRDDLVVRRRIFGGETKYVVKDPLRLEYCTVDEMAWQLLRLCDGQRDLAELSEAAEKLFPGMGLNPLALLNFYETYRGSHFFEDTWERNIYLIERTRTNRSRALKKAVANPLEIHLPAWDPDRFFGRIVGPLGFLFTRKALAVYTLIILGAIWLSTTNSQQFALSFHELWVIRGKTFIGIVTLWIILLFTVVLHEMGHGLTCKHFGGGVHKIGFLFLYFNPCMFCDVTEAYFFDDKRKKHAVTLAGGIVDLVTASLAVYVWYVTSADTFVHEVAHRIAIFNGISGILVNFNPLMKYDGYYLVSDQLEIPNLRGDSFRFLGNRIRGLLGLTHEPEMITSRERRIFWVFGSLGVFYAIFVLWFVLMLVGGFLTGKFGAAGYILTAGLVVLMTRRYARGLAGFVRFVSLDKAAHFRRYRLAYLGFVGLLVAAFFLLPLPRHLRADFVFEPGEEMVLRAQEPGVIEEVRAEEGDLVRAGTPPVVLRSEPLELERNQARSVLSTAGTARTAAQVAHDRGEAAVQANEAGWGLARDRYLASREVRVTPVAPWDGVVMTPWMREKLGAAVSPGDTLCVLADLRTMRAEILFDEADLGRLNPGKPVELRTRSRPGRLLIGRIERIGPEPSGRDVRTYYRLIVRVDEGQEGIRPGITGVARFDAGAVPPYQHVLDQLTRLFRIEFWI